MIYALDFLIKLLLYDFFNSFRVKLLINQDHGEAVAAKIIDLGKHADAVDAVRKEIAIHRMLKHNNVIKFYGKLKF